MLLRSSFIFKQGLRTDFSENEAWKREREPSAQLRKTCFREEESYNLGQRPPWEGLGGSEAQRIK